MVKEKSFIQNLSISYECALAIGNSLNLSEMLNEVIRTIVHKTNAHRGSIWLCTEGEYGIKIGARTGSKLTKADIKKRKKHFRDVFEKICIKKQFVIKYREEKDFFQYCFNITEKEQSVLLISIEKIAILHLVYASREKVDNTLGNILIGLSGKLSIAIKACLVYENIIKEIQVRKKTEKELKRKTSQLISSQKELKNLYSESEVSRKSLLSILEDVVEKERALRESEQKFRILVQHSPLGIFRADTKGNILVVNPALLKILGSPSEEKTKEINLLTFPLLINSGISKFIEECLKKRKSMNREFIYKSKWGKESHINFYITLLYDEGEHLIGVQGIIENITERKKAEDKYINQLKNMIDLGISMRVELKLEKLLQNICDIIIKSLGWQQVILSLRDYEAGTSRPVAMSGYDEKIVENAFSKPPVSFDILNKFLKDKYKISRSYYIDHTNWKMVKKYPAFIITPSRDPKPEGWDERDFLLIPITGKKNILGFISPDNPVSGERPTKETIQALEIFADQAAVAIENAKLYEELQNSENRFQDIAVNTGDWIWETDEKGCYTYCSPIVNQVLGYEYKEMLGKYFYDFFAPAERDKMKKATLNTFIKKESFHNFINRNIHKDGREVILETSGIPIIGANGELIGYRGVDRDITEREQQELFREMEIQLLDKLRGAKTIEDCFNLGCEAIQKVGLFKRAVLTLHNKEREIIYLGQAGLKPKFIEQARKASAPDLNLKKKIESREFKVSHSYFVPEEAGLKFEQSGRYVPQNKQFNITTNNSWQSGDELFVPVISKDGKTEGYLSVDTPFNGKRPDKQVILDLEDVVDIVTRQVHEIQNMEILRESEEKYRVLAENTLDCIWKMDQDLQFNYINQSIFPMLGFTREEWIGTTLAEHCSEKELQHFINIVEDELMKEETYSAIFEMNLFHKDSREISLEILGKILLDKNKKITGFQGNARDITERKRAEQIQTTIYNISNAVNTAKDLNEFFETLHTQLSKIINTTNFYLALYNKENDTFSLPYHVDKKDRFTSFPAGRTLTSYVIRKGKSLLATEKDCDDLVKAGEIDLVGTPSKIWLGVPLKIENEVIGLVGVQSYTEETIYDEEDVKILEFVSDQTALAIDRMEKAEQINKDLEEKKVMLMEIHHRVKNNMQVISSMLKLQSRYIRDDHDLKLFNDSCHRVKSMSLIHEKLYQSKDLTSIDFADYVKSLTIHLFSSFGIDVSIIKFIINIKSVLLNINMAIPCGLIVNELITNSLKYAFPDNRKGEISINLKTEPCIETPEGKIYSLIVSDNGIGIPADIDFENTDSFGLQLVNTLIHQLHANIEIDRKSGTSFKIVFKELQL